MERRESREEAWRRVSAMAGLDENGCLLPPPRGLRLVGCEWWGKPEPEPDAPPEGGWPTSG